MTVKKEIERKFRVLNFTESDLESLSTEAVFIQQTYLMTRGEQLERRIRSLTSWILHDYYYTEKRSTADPLVRIEEEREISEEEYLSLLKEKDLSTETILKRRYIFNFYGQKFELDVYNRPINKLVILEIELSTPDQRVILPPGWTYEEVTTNKKYKNAEIARGSLNHLAVSTS